MSEADSATAAQEPGMQGIPFLSQSARRIIDEVIKQSMTPGFCCTCKGFPLCKYCIYAAYVSPVCGVFVAVMPYGSTFVIGSYRDVPSAETAIETPKLRCRNLRIPETTGTTVSGSF